MTPAEELKQANELLDEALPLVLTMQVVGHKEPDVVLKAGDLASRIFNRPRATEDEGTGENDILSYLHHDINTLPTEDVCALYSYMRRHMIAKIPGLEDPLAHFRTKPRLTPPKDVCPTCGSNDPSMPITRTIFEDCPDPWHRFRG